MIGSTMNAENLKNYTALNPIFHSHDNMAARSKIG